MIRLFAFLLAFAGLLPSLRAETQWIWASKNNVSNQQVWLRGSFEVGKLPSKAELVASADNHCKVWINGKEVGGSDDWEQPVRANLNGHLKAGRNTIAVLARNDGGVAAFALRVTAGKAILFESGSAWKASQAEPAKGWEAANFDDAKWEKATVVQKYGTSPWGDVLANAKKTPVAAADDLILPAGFKADLVHLVPRGTQGTWVSLAVSPQGDLVAGDQLGVLWRVSLADPAKPVVTKIDTQFFGCHGLLFAHGALYACTSEKGKGDIWRLRDTKGDGSYAEQTLIRALKGSGEHGPHQLVLERDGSILVVGGNHTALPDDEKAGAPVRRWDEDDLLKKFEDANGHAVGIKAVGGWIARMDKDGKDWVRVATGFRNAYDASIAPDGDIFTYDSDMEWDMGAPWYRPTRIYLAARGGELGWLRFRQQRLRRPRHAASAARHRSGQPHRLHDGHRRQVPRRLPARLLRLRLDLRHPLRHPPRALGRRLEGPQGSLRGRQALLRHRRRHPSAGWRHVRDHRRPRRSVRPLPHPLCRTGIHRSRRLV